jgi:hypothetical protein
MLFILFLCLEPLVDISLIEMLYSKVHWALKLKQPRVILLLCYKARWNHDIN